MDFVETDEQLMLREAVASIAARYGHEYYVERSRTSQKTDELWDELASAGYLGVNVPAQYGGGGQGITELAIVEEELGPKVARCSCSSYPPTMRHDHRCIRDRRAEDPLASRIRRRHPQDGLRDHRARRRIQLAQHLDKRDTRRGRLPAQRDEVLHLGL